MTLNYYFRNIFPGLVLVCMSFYGWMQSPENDMKLTILIFTVVSCLLCPFSKKCLESIALRFTNRCFWQKRAFTDSAGGSLIALFYVFCFILAIPFSFIYFIFNVKSLKHKSG
ncbi:colicin E1 (microcin) immunity protein [Enterobacter sp. BIGb0383]|uniref:colicin E1 family microcin immunity protein n=2 Tax=unclassified Enterobacter TaxID=2608935 RepID=UPI000F48E2D5|nr:colicin E1 (microcin) immunity protein [Enterobacter sp. BIGb0383]ROS09165.1 colicin E1 (microcin) immunity protein [Enterobacter sp. BIGb0359]